MPVNWDFALTAVEASMSFLRPAPDGVVVVEFSFLSAGDSVWSCGDVSAVATGVSQERPVRLTLFRGGDGDGIAEVDFFLEGLLDLTDNL